MASVCDCPAAMRVAVHAVATRTGCSERVVVPMPSCPLPFKPQVQIVPFDASATEWAAPAAMAVMGGKPATITGAVRVVVVLSPNCPW
jgi:hypothetical protein